MDLTGKILIAMPGMGDPRFAHSVVLLCAYSEDGAMGLIVNKSVEGMALAELFEQLEIEAKGESGTRDVFFGGPVETGRGFVLHTPDYRSELSTLDIDGRFAMTATQDVLEEIAEGRGPSGALVALGYSGWGPGQLEAEIADNGWLIAEPTQALVFHEDPANVWPEALKSLGIDPITLSATAGHA
ncbi:YqgE/AlgH family protein [uncultured Shimia sp.]|uniref:YqgE/AlgH family protein n=1 Tax=uncultured Shimia sp. TaxID=573152 RepID=UPI002605D317|nr:YqgE/AlgH family protein [uncultured Shimia sp.]